MRGTLWHVVGALPGGDRLVIESHARESRALARAAQLARQLEGYESITVEADRMSDTGNGKSVPLKLRDAEARTPPVDPVRACQASLQLALFDAIGAQDICDVVKKLKSMALAGDLKATQLLLGLVLGGKGAAPQPPPQQIVVVTGKGRRARQRGEPPTGTRDRDTLPPLADTPGVETPLRRAKLPALEARADRGEPLNDGANEGD